MGSDKGFVEWEHEFCALVVVVAMNPSIRLTVLKLFSVFFCLFLGFLQVMGRTSKFPVC